MSEFEELSRKVEAVSEEFRHEKPEKTLGGNGTTVKPQEMEVVDADDARTKTRKWRYKVQKVFLSDSMLKDEAMPAVDALFREIEAYDQMTLDALAVSKIGKVMRHVAVLTDEKVPLDSVFHFRQRATALVRKWQGIINGVRATNEASLVDPAATKLGATHEEVQTPTVNAAAANEKSTSDDQDPEFLKVRQWRHEVQKAFLSGTTPRDEDLPAFDALFKTIESYREMTVRCLEYSKLGKMMRHVALLNDDKVPRDSEYNFRERAQALVDKWIVLLSTDHPDLPTTSVATETDCVRGDESAAVSYPPPSIGHNLDVETTSDGAPEPLASHLGERSSLPLDDEEWILVDAVKEMRLS